MEQQPLLDLQIDYDSGNQFKEAANWARLIAIFVFICAGITLPVLLFSASKFMELMSVSMPIVQQLGNIFLFIVFIVIAIYLYIFIQLFRFTRLIKEGINRQDQETINAALKALRNFFVVNGVLTILSIIYSIYQLLVSF